MNDLGEVGDRGRREGETGRVGGSESGHVAPMASVKRCHVGE